MQVCDTVRCSAPFPFHDHYKGLSIIALGPAEACTHSFLQFVLPPRREVWPRWRPSLEVETRSPVRAGKPRKEGMTCRRYPKRSAALSPLLSQFQFESEAMTAGYRIKETESKKLLKQCGRYREP